MQRERDRLTKHRKQQLERARHEAHLAERQYRTVDPENRLVARTLEQRWEEALRKERQAEEEFDRFQREIPPRITPAEQALIRSLSSDIPALWQAAGTTAVDRKEIIRCLIDRVVVNVRGDTELVDVTIRWTGGFVSQHLIQRPVSSYQQLMAYDDIVERIVRWKQEGLTAAQMADRLNQEGFRPPGCPKFAKSLVQRLFSRIGLSKPRCRREKLESDEWAICELARRLQVSTGRLRHWIRKGYVHCRKASGRYWVLWADQDELDRLRELRDHLKTEHSAAFPAKLTTPKFHGDNG